LWWVTDTTKVAICEGVVILRRKKRVSRGRKAIKQDEAYAEVTFLQGGNGGDRRDGNLL